MARSSKMFRRIAVQIAKLQIQNIRLRIVAYVDGYPLAGYSIFRQRPRTQAELMMMETVVQKENGKLVEYYKYPTPIDLLPDHDQKRESFETGGKIVFSPNHHPSSSRQQQDSPTTTGCGAFEWSCQELSFAQLNAGWGDICVQEYLGQKLVISWACGYGLDSIEREREEAAEANGSRE